MPLMIFLRGLLAITPDTPALDALMDRKGAICPELRAVDKFGDTLDERQPTLQRGFFRLAIPEPVKAGKISRARACYLRELVQVF